MSKKYDEEFITQALKLQKEVGSTDAAKQLGISRSTLDVWRRRHEDGTFQFTAINNKPENALSIKEENKLLKEQNKALEKRIKRIEEENEFLKEASAFFAASHPKLKRMNDLNS